MAVSVKPCTVKKAESVFMSYAVRAVLDEQNSNFQQAGELWAKAMVFSRIDVNRVWAGSRMAFCANAVSRGWSNHRESD